MKHADIFVLPSRFEGFGIAAIEAMALGVPTIVANFPAATEYVIPERTGLTFPIGDHSALAACLTRLIKDPKLRDKLSHEGSTYVRHAYSETVQYGKYERVIDKMTSVADQIA
jgi:glycosyltransferase involved in cell wall biosynthesis